MTDTLAEAAFRELCLRNTGCKTPAQHLLRSGGVMRYHNEPGVPCQEVAAHTWRLICIMLNIWPDCSRDLIISAQYHDIEEGLTGDIPAPLKWDKPELKLMIDEIGTRYYCDVVNIVPADLQKWEVARMKCADYLELADYCSQFRTPAAHRIMRTGLRAVSSYARALTPSDSVALASYVRSMRERFVSAMTGTDDERQFRADLNDIISELESV